MAEAKNDKVGSLNIENDAPVADAEAPLTNALINQSVGETQRIFRSYKKAELVENSPLYIRVEFLQLPESGLGKNQFHKRLGQTEFFLHLLKSQNLSFPNFRARSPDISL